MAGRLTKQPQTLFRKLHGLDWSAFDWPAYRSGANGAALAISPPETLLWKILCFVAFVVVGGLAVIVNYVDRRNAAKQMLGGDEFCFVMALYTPGMDPKGRFPLVVTNPWDRPLYDVTILISARGGFPTDGRTVSVGTLHPHQFMRELGLSIPLGDYVVDIRTRASPNGFFERLTLTVDDEGKISQRYYVRRTGSDNKLMDAH
jgi:hypothetical protein